MRSQQRQPFSVKVVAPCLGLNTRIPSISGVMEPRDASFATNMRFEDGVACNSPGYEPVTMTPAPDGPINLIAQANTASQITTISTNSPLIGTTKSIYAVNGVNPYLAVDAGPDQVITVDHTSIRATYRDGYGGGSNIPALLWTQVSGPSCTIVSPPSQGTDLTGMPGGVYVFQIAASDSGVTVTDTLQITVNHYGNTFQSFTATCTAPLVGDPVTVNIPANTYFDSTQAGANALALAAATSEAEAALVCTLPPVFRIVYSLAGAGDYATRLTYLPSTGFDTGPISSYDGDFSMNCPAFPSGVSATSVQMMFQIIHISGGALNYDFSGSAAFDVGITNATLGGSMSPLGHTDAYGNTSVAGASGTLYAGGPNYLYNALFSPPGFLAQSSPTPSGTATVAKSGVLTSGSVTFFTNVLSNIANDEGEDIGFRGASSTSFHLNGH